MASSSAMTTRAGLESSPCVIIVLSPSPERSLLPRRHGGEELVLAPLEVSRPSCGSASRAFTIASAWRVASLCSWVASGVSETRARTLASSADSWTTVNCSLSTASSSRARTRRAWTSLIRRSSRTRCMERQV